MSRLIQIVHLDDIFFYLLLDPDEGFNADPWSIQVENHRCPSIVIWITYTDNFFFRPKTILTIRLHAFKFRYLQFLAPPEIIWWPVLENILAPPVLEHWVR